MVCDWSPVSNNPTKLEQQNINIYVRETPTLHDMKHETATKNVTQTSVLLTPVVFQFRLVDLFSVGARPSYKLRKTLKLFDQ